ncbi:hypothetical protein MESS4_330018 [Mesorhizobium sp. STM 4661]|nr:hypothetical protein MESS4_330018 [Mesorhizobium sp. STM 4661]
MQYAQVSRLDHANENQFLTTNCKTADRTQAHHGQTLLMVIAGRQCPGSVAQMQRSHSAD